MMAPDKKSKIEAEQKKLSEELSLIEEEEKLASLKKRKGELKSEIQAALAAGKEVEELVKDLKELEVEIWAEERKVDSMGLGKNEKEEALRLKGMTRRRKACEVLVEKLLPEAEEARRQLAEQCRRLGLAAEVFRRNVPMRLERIQSKVIFIRKLEPAPDGGPGRFVEHTIQLHQLPRARGLGWEPRPGEDLTLEPLTDNNAIRLPAVQAPQIVEKAEAFCGEFLGLTATITEGDIEAFERTVE